MRTVDEGLIETLRMLGLTKYEALAYIALLSLGEATALEVIREAGIPHPRAYDVLTSLYHKGLIEVTGTKPRRYRVIPPDIALDNLKKRLVERVNKAKEVLKQMSKERGVRQPSVWVMYEYENVLARMKEFINHARHECLLAIPLSSVRAIRGALERAIVRNIIPLIILYKDSKAGEEKKLTPLEDVEQVEIFLREVPGTIICLTDCLNMVVAPYKASLQSLSNMNYGVMIVDPELANVMSFYYYYSLFLGSRPLKELDAEDFEGTSFTSIWRAVYAIKRILRMGYRVKVEVYGKELMTGEDIALEGWVRDVVEDVVRHVYSIILDDGTSIGGYNATLEDVEGRLIRIIRVE